MGSKERRCQRAKTCPAGRCCRGVYSALPGVALPGRAGVAFRRHCFRQRKENLPCPPLQPTRRAATAHAGCGSVKRHPSQTTRAGERLIAEFVVRRDRAAPAPHSQTNNQPMSQPR